MQLTVFAKGKIERPFDFIRESFWRGYPFSNLNAANRDLASWLLEKSERIHGTTHERVDMRFEREKPNLLALPPAACDVSERIMRTVYKDCTVRIDGNRYVLPHKLVGKEVLGRRRGNVLRLFDNDVLVVTYTIPEGKGHLVQDERFYRELREDKEMQARKFARRGKHKARALTLSPSKPKYPIDVQQRDIAVYQQLGGEVAYA